MSTQSSNFRALAGLELMLGKAWFKHGPNLAPTWFIRSRHSKDMFLRPYSLSLENFRGLGGLEGNLCQTWSKHGPVMVPIYKGETNKIFIAPKGIENSGELVIV